MKFLIVVFWCVLPLCASAQSRDFTLSAPPQIVETGLLAHLLPRFSLKHGVRVTLVAGDGDASIGDAGTPVFTGLGTIWHLSHGGGAGPVLFQDWLTSDIGTRTIIGFQPEGSTLFSTEIAAASPEIMAPLDGDPVAGARLSLQHCGRCHVVNDSNRMKGMGQTPSFALMRTFADWQNRFATFYVLNPHPSFTQVAGITKTFRADLPPAIVPLEITARQIDDIVAYVATVAPADLGAPLQTQ